ncbi:MAG: phosphoribosylamine--glycine ligase [Micavibrio sp.]|nr:phosphoribosylamine--glycine ligase [Micavibrio sp.]|tara:strand:- start:442 stop:1719 length:1278 start_codon:yes stop_codon:yes gene_type:complete
MKVLLVGSGGREHALAWALAQSDNCSALYCAPGNAGIEQCAELVAIQAEDVDRLTTFSKDNEIDLVIIGPEAPLVLGLADRLHDAGIDVFGPSAKAAQLEGSKGFMKDICKKYGIPTAAYERFTDVTKAKKFIDDNAIPIVVKADGLAAGKGVIICETRQQAYMAVEEMLSGAAFGDAGQSVVIEEFMDGEELSYFALADGKTILPLTSAQDHKRAFDGDQGPNTGGMGAYSPAHMMTADLEEKIIHRIIEPTVKAMADEGAPFTGVLFAGLMVVDGEPKLIEYNARFGDPECQTLVARLQGDLLKILQASAQGRLDDIKGQVSWSEQTAMCVVMAAKGYPGSYEKNTLIQGLSEAEEVENTIVFHAGTSKNEDGDIVSVGGRVLGITATGDNIGHARRLAYEAVERVNWPDGFCRHDIGHRALP